MEWMGIIRDLMTLEKNSEFRNWFWSFNKTWKIFCPVSISSLDIHNDYIRISLSCFDSTWIFRSFPFFDISHILSHLKISLFVFEILNNHIFNCGIEKIISSFWINHWVFLLKLLSNLLQEKFKEPQISSYHHKLM